MVLGCGASPTGRPDTGPAAPDVTPPEPNAPPPEPTAAPDPSAPLVGWWRGDHVCLELFANGDFELSLPQHDPKMVAHGAATLTPAGDVVELRLATARIWRGRFTSPCRKVHELGGWADDLQALGAAFKPGETTTLKLRRVGDAQIELCGTSCATLTRAIPNLGARWRRAQLTIPDRPEAPFAPGDLLELQLDDSSAHLWAGLPGGEIATANGTTAAKFVGPDRFAVTFTVTSFSDLPAGAPFTALGLTFGAGEPRTLDVRRLAGERIEVCAAPGRCATLERQFDAYHHDLD